MTRPTNLPTWNTNEVNTIEPDSSRQDNGWLAPGGIPQKPSFQYFNWWMNNVYKWIKHQVEAVYVDDDNRVEIIETLSVGVTPSATIPFTASITSGTDWITTLVNTSATGKGLYVQGGDTGKESLRIDNRSGIRLFSLIAGDAFNYGRLWLGAGTSTTFPSVSTGADDIVLGAGSGNIGMTIWPADTGTGAIYWKKGTANTDGFLEYNNNTQSLFLGTNTNTRVTIDSSGNVRFNNYGAGTLVTDASGNITASSDENLKENFEELDIADAINMINGFVAEYYNWTEESGLDVVNRQLGFRAQNINQYCPEAGPKITREEIKLKDTAIDKKEEELVEEDYIVEAKEIWGIHDRAIIAAQNVVIKDLLKRVEALENKAP